MRGFGAIAARVYRLLYSNAGWNRTIVDLLDLTAEDRVLEVGCGPGAAVERAAASIGAEQVAAIDPSPTFVDMVRKRVPGADARAGAADDIPFEDGKFTVIWSIASMHHWPSREPGLAAQAAKLAPGGRLVIAERLLRKPGHGITEAQSAEVMDYLKGLGMAGVESVTVPYRSRTIRLIRATAA